MGYLHVEVASAQSPKKPGAPCGDLVRWERRELWTTVACCDGLGSEIKANLTAELFVSRLLELERCGVSLRDAFGRVAHTIHAGRARDGLYAALSVVRILPNGECTTMGYDAPPPILVSAQLAQLLPRRSFELEGAEVGEAHCKLGPGEGVLLLSDGVTQAGIGSRFREGWGSEGVVSYLTDCLASGIGISEVPRIVHDQARRYWGSSLSDDVTAVLAWCRPGRSLTILTGPPRTKDTDRRVAERFLRSDGCKVVCGATTAQIVARHLGAELQVRDDDASLVAPARYGIQGIDLVTEGAITLNQVFNILEIDPQEYEEVSGVTDLCDLLREADRIHFIVGRSQNPANFSIAFQQKGILNRTTIVPLLADKLRQLQKHVSVEWM